MGGSERASRLESLSREILAMCGRATGLETTYLTLIHRDAHEQEILYSRNVGSLLVDEGLRVDWSDTLCRLALEGEGPSYTNDVPKAYPHSEAAAALGLQTYLSVPVTRAGGGPTLGTLCGASSRSVDVNPEARVLMESLAAMVAMQLDLEDSSDALGRDNAELETVANTDALSGVANRRRLETELDHLAAVGRGELSIALLDIDRFKSVNDTYGHLAGDEAIVHVAECLKEVARRNDLVARLGGDEFVLLLFGASVYASVAVAERIAGCVAARDADTSVGPVPVRVSVGVATGPARDARRLLAEADEALYEAKQHRP